MKAPLLPVLCLFAFPAAAQVSWYAGASGGSARTDDEIVANRESTILNASNVSTAFDERDTAWKLFAGARLNPIVGLELAYADLGRSRLDTRLLGGDPPFPAGIAIDRKAKAWGADLVLFAPLGVERLDLFGKAGYYRTKLDVGASLDGNIQFSNGDPAERSRASSRREDTFHWGLGAQYAVTRNLAVRAEYERFTSIGKPFAVGGSGTTGQADVDLVSLAVVYRF